VEQFHFILTLSYKYAIINKWDTDSMKRNSRRAKVARISVEMTVTDAIAEIVDGNPGAITACVDILNHGEAWGLFYLDELGIYGKRIYTLWSNVCDSDALKTLAVLYAARHKRAGVDTHTLNHAIDNRGGIEWDGLEPIIELLRASSAVSGSSAG
jgi:hypothetical protein